MEREKLIEAIKKAKASEKKRNFTQSIDLAINLKELDVKKAEAKIEEWVKLPHGRAKSAKVCAFVGPELKDQAEKLCDVTILIDNFSKWTDKRKCKKLTRQCDFFIAQANIMPSVAKTFGRFLAPVGKMPNPKAGQIVPPKANLEPLVNGLKNTVKIAIKKAPVIHCNAGSETFSDEQIADNILAIINRLKAKLPKKEHNIASLIIKTTMGAPIKVV